MAAIIPAKQIGKVSIKSLLEPPTKTNHFIVVDFYTKYRRSYRKIIMFLYLCQINLTRKFSKFWIPTVKMISFHHKLTIKLLLMTKIIFAMIADIPAPGLILSTKKDLV